MTLTQFFDEKIMVLQLKSVNKIDAITELADKMYQAGNIEDEDSFLESVIEREGMSSTGIGNGVAVPHSKSDVAKKLTIAFGLSSDGIDFDAIDGEKVHLVFLLAAPKEEIGLYLKALAELSKLLDKKEFRESLMNAESAEEVIKAIDNFESGE